MAQFTRTTPESGQWQCPQYVTEVIAEVWGGGGGGGASTTYYNNTGRGGGGGAYARKTVPVTPGQYYSYYVGAGGSAGSGSGGDGGNGEDSWFVDSSTVLAKGGQGGQGGVADGGVGGQATECIGDVCYSGGNGAGGGGGSLGGGGGGSAGSASNGNNASGSTGGVAVTDGGPGADGTSTNGQKPSTGPGGGGSGGHCVLAGTYRPGGAGYEGKLRLTWYIRPNTPTISAPEAGYTCGPGTQITLTAVATHPTGSQVKYRWYYNSGSGDVLIGESSYVESGTSASIDWDTTGKSVGDYTLKCWAVCLDGSDEVLSAECAQRTVYLRYALIDSPADGSSTVAGVTEIAGRAWYGTGQVALQVEVDTNNPPDSGSDDYQLLESEYGGQGDSHSLWTYLTLGTWYMRARAKDDSEPPNTSSWTDVSTLYVREALKLLAGSEVEQSTVEAVNKVYVLVKDTDIVESASYESETDPLSYTTSPREDVVVLSAGDATVAAAIASLVLAQRRQERVMYGGLAVSLKDGLKLERGQRVGVQIDRLGVSGTYPIRELQFDIPGGRCLVTIGDAQLQANDVDALVTLARRVNDLERGTA